MREASGGGTIFLGAASASCCPLTRLLVCPDIRLAPGRCSAWLARVQMSQRTRSHGDRTCYVVQADLCMQVGRLARAVAQGPRFRRNASTSRSDILLFDWIIFRTRGASNHAGCRGHEATDPEQRAAVVPAELAARLHRYTR